MSQSLVAFDTDQIKSYVFATGKLKEIRGGSALLDRLNREKMPKLVGGTAIYANGGAGLFVVDTGRADKVIHSVQRVYRQKTHTASITGVAIELPEDTDGDIQSQLDLIRYRLRAAKDSQSTPTLPLTHPLLHFCDSCGIQYAKTYDEGDRLCASCKVKRDADELVKKEIEQWASGQRQPNSDRLWGRLIEGLKKQSYPISGYERPEDFEKLGDLSSPGGYMALIYADGDDMGREIEQIRTRSEMERFAKVVDTSVYQAVEEAIAEHLKPTGDKFWPFDVLLLGGDDLVMVSRAQSAIDVTLHVVERFPALTKELWGRPLNLSASVVLAHINYPFGALLELAESGLKFAKRQAAKRKLGGQTVSGGLINFLVVSSANHLDFSKYYKQTLKHQERHKPTLYRTQRPYTASEMRNLLDKIQKLRDLNVPRTKLEQLRAAIFKSRQQATIDAMMATLRLRSERQRDALFELVGTTDEEKLRLPWIREGVHEEERWKTPILDVVELLDFVR